MLLAALLLGAGLAYWLTRRIRALAHATNALIHGDYDRAPRRCAATTSWRSSRGDFNTLAATLAAAREARQQWIADIAHELRTPLAVLRAEIESLQDGVRPLDQAAVASLAHETARLARLVEDLHTLSLSDLGALTYHKEPVDLAEVVADTVEAQRRAIDERGLQLELQLDCRARMVLADADAARAGLREPAAEQPALHRCAREDLDRAAARGRTRHRRLAGQRARAFPPRSCRV